MQAREAARLAREEAIESGGAIKTALLCAGSIAVERMILRAFALAGYGWRDIAEAEKKEGVTYWITTWNDTIPVTRSGYWGGILGWCDSDNDEQISPTHFHELPSPPTKKENSE